MKQAQQPWYRNSIQAVATVALTLTMLIVSGLIATTGVAFADDQSEDHGIISERPEESPIGVWVIDGDEYVTTDETEFNEENGALAVNACAQVLYREDDDTNYVKKMRSLSLERCAGDDSEEEVDEGERDQDRDRDVMHAYGLLVSKPDSGDVGTWIIGDASYFADEETEVRADDGPFADGACVHVKYVEEETEKLALGIETEDADKCDGNTDDSPGDGDETGDGDHDEDRDRDALRAYGLLVSKPDSGDAGTWLIGDASYLADEETEIDAEHGPFVADACVKVKYVEDGTEKLALEIETEHAYKCGRDESDPSDGDDGDDGAGDRVRGELYGELQSFPDDLMGIWEIGGEQFLVNGETELKRENGAFEIGVIVKVHFYEILDAEQEGVRVATEIETKVRGDDDDDDGDDDGDGDDDDDGDDGDDQERDDNSGDGNRHSNAHSSGHAYGLIDSFPNGTPGPIGPWVIGDIAYMATERTKFYQVEGLYEVGACVVVRYWRDENAQRIARAIKTDEDACDGETAEGKLFGFVDEMPAPRLDGSKAYTGTWNISGAVLEADEETMFKETKGLLVEGAYVKVIYTTDGDSNYMVSIETQVPPGAGEHIRRGRVERIADDNVGAAAVSVGQTWVVDGQSYRVLDGTSLDESTEVLGVGSLVEINSYTDDDGSQIATQISSVSLDQTVYLPLVTR